MLTRFVVRENGRPINHFYGKEREMKRYLDYATSSPMRDGEEIRDCLDNDNKAKVTKLTGPAKSEFQQYGYVTNQTLYAPKGRGGKLK